MWRRYSRSQARWPRFPPSKSLLTGRGSHRRDRLRAVEGADERRRDVPRGRTLCGNAAGQEGCTGGGVPYDPPGEDSRKGAPTGTGRRCQCLAGQATGCLHDQTDGAGRWRLSEGHRTIVLGRVPHHSPRHVTGAYRRLWVATSRAVSGTRSTERAPRARDAMPRQHLEVHFGRRHRRDLVDQCSAYACPMHAHARPLRRATSTCRSPRNRSSPATSRRAHPAYACVRRIDKAPRKTPEKLASPTGARTRTCWSQRCAYAKGREEIEELVAGVTRQRTTIGFQTGRKRW